VATLDLALYLASSLLAAAGLTWLKHGLAGAVPTGLLAVGWRTAIELAAASVVYLSGMFLWLIVLGRNPMSTAYPIGIGLSLVTTTVAAIVVLGEPVGALRLAGIAAILAGAVCIGRSK
jgi:quaternary ammonium compound-resistance protein SugE